MTPPVEPPLTPLTLREAATYAGVSISTVRRRKTALLAAGATITPSGWSIPITALNTVFMTPPGRAHDTPPVTHVDTPADSPLVTQLRSENDFLRKQIEQQARTIERQAEAHAIISAQLTQLKQFEVSPVADNPPVATRQKRWWQFR